MAAQAGDAHASLRNLVFAADQAFAAAASEGSEGSVASAQTAVLHLKSLLSVTAAGSPASRRHADSLLQQCTSRLQKLTVQRSQDRPAHLAQLLKQAGCPDGFRFTNPAGSDLGAKLRQSEPFKSLLGGPLPSRKVNLARPPPATRGPVTAAAQRPPPGVLAEQPGNQAGQPPQRRSGFQVPIKPRPGPASGGAAGAAAHAGHDPTQRPPQHPQHDQHPQRNQQGPHPGPPSYPGPGAPQRHPQQQHPQQQPQAQHPPPGDSRWAAHKLARRAQDAHVHDSRQHGQAQGQGQGPGAGRGRSSGGEDEVNLLSSGDDGADAQGGRSIPGFQTAKTKLIADMRKNGQQYYGNAGGAGGGAPGDGSQYGGGGGGPPPRQGLARPGGGGLRPPGLRKNGPGGGPGGGALGASGKFVPPYLRKALEAQNGGGNEGEAEGPLSLRTLEILRLAPGEPLPEALAKLDPLLIENVCNEVMDSGGQLDWNDIAGQQTAKDLIQEVVVWPIKNPALFTGARAPPKGILLFGPPGTGKTMLGKAIATNISAVFFSISSSSLVSKWMGEGEKLVRALFAVAAHVAPSVIFIDEVDSLLSARKAEGEHESMRRMKTEILIQMEGIDPSRADCRVLLIGATNRPEELDEAARRRMPKQLYIPLPDGDARRDLILRQLGPGGPIKAHLSDADLDKVVARTQGYSGSDMKMLIQEACQGPVRDAFKANGSVLSELTADALRAVVVRDFQMAARAQKASVEPKEIERYEQYNEKHGAKLAGAGGKGEEEDDEW